MPRCLTCARVVSTSVCLYDGTPSRCCVVDEDDDQPTHVGETKAAGGVTIRSNRVLAAAMKRAREDAVNEFNADDPSAVREFERDESTARRLLDQAERDALDDEDFEPATPMGGAPGLGGKNAAALRAALASLRAPSPPVEDESAKTQLALRPEASSFDARRTQVAARSTMDMVSDTDATQIAVKVPHDVKLPPLPSESGPELTAHDTLPAPMRPMSTNEIPLIDDADVESEVIDSAKTALATGDLLDPVTVAPAEGTAAAARGGGARTAKEPVSSSAEQGLSFEPLVVVEGDALGTGELEPYEVPPTDEVSIYDDRSEPFGDKSASSTMVVRPHRVSSVTQLVEAPPERLRPRWVLWGVIALAVCVSVGVAVYIASPPELGSHSQSPRTSKAGSAAAAAARVDASAPSSGSGS
ncbi:MAG: hypothetical protein KC503_10010, partial [Myxococcales bacterium]|nr:hypothetical protein [Myxococcales bacterium]